MEPLGRGGGGSPGSPGLKGFGREFSRASGGTGNDKLQMDGISVRLVPEIVVTDTGKESTESLDFPVYKDHHPFGRCDVAIENADWASSNLLPLM